MRVVVTGGAGFVGANVCRALLDRPWPGGTAADVVVLDDFSTGYRANLDGLDVEVREGSVLDATLLDELVGGADAVVHLAALPSVARSLLDPVGATEVNVTGTVQVLDAARRAGSHVVLASSSSVYGSNPELPRQEHHPTRPLSPYGASKLAAESYGLAFGASFGMTVLAVRFFNIFGPWQSSGHPYAAVVPRFVAAALAGEPVEIHGDGRQTRDFTYVASVAEVLADAVARRVGSPAPVNLAFGTRTDLLTLVSVLEEVVGRAIGVRHVAARPGDVRDSQAGTETMRRLFPHARPRDLRVALAATVDWYAGRTAVLAAPTAVV